jgi:hypothetical protein
VAIGIGANPDPSSRSGTLTVAGQTVTVNQDAAPPACTFSLSDTTLSVTAAAADETTHVNASASSCPWTASSGVTWMTITSGASGTGNGPVGFHVDANPDPSPRTGTLTIAGQTLTVTQDAGP